LQLTDLCVLGVGEADVDEAYGFAGVWARWGGWAGDARDAEAEGAARAAADAFG
jgi:hypothetical protein